MKNLILLMVLFFGISGSGFAYESEHLEKLVPLYEIKKEPGPFDWLTHHPEPGQTVSQYESASFSVPNKDRPYIYIVLLGDVDDEQNKILEMTIRYVEKYFQVPVKVAEPIQLSAIPSFARRNHPQTQEAQILSTYVIEQVLKPRIPPDAFAYIALTTSDLWPGEGWNFVFGQASMDDRIGVWSMFRNGNPKENFQLVLRRTIKIATHEIGHMFGLEHCIYYECNMNGSNSRVESDKQPLWDCPVCLRKIAMATKMDLVKRYRELLEISREYHMYEEAEFFKKVLLRLEK